MRIMHMYKSNKYRSMICRISQKPRNDRKIKTVKFLFCKVYSLSMPSLLFRDKSSLSSFDGDSDCKRYQNSGAKHHVFAAVGKYFILVQAFLSILKEVRSTINF